MNRNKREHFTGCLLGSAVGDALGWPVEFGCIDDIVKRFGPKGILNMASGKDGLCEIVTHKRPSLLQHIAVYRLNGTIIQCHRHHCLRPYLCHQEGTVQATCLELNGNAQDHVPL